MLKTQVVQHVRWKAATSNLNLKKNHNFLCNSWQLTFFGNINTVLVSIQSGYFTIFIKI